MRRGPSLQGDLEGKPGRDLEVHHQGPDHALKAARRRRSPPVALTAALLVLVAASCGSSGDKSKDSGTSAGQASRPPAQGTILYHEPLPSTGLDKKTVPPKTFVFTTAEEELAEDNAIRTFSGTVPPGQDASEVARRLLGAPKANTRLLSAAKFENLWDRLETTGILELPRYRGKDLPEREDYFLFQSAAGRVVITRPTVASPPRPDDPGIARLGVWRKAKLELFDFLNER